MRGRVTIIIILVSIVLLIFSTVKGIKIGEFQILSVSQLKEKNDSLSAKVEKANSLATTDYQNNVKKLEETFKQYLRQKQKYEQLVDVTDGTNEQIYETKQYDISYLWRVLGNYATNRNLKLAINVTENKTVKNTYDFNFTVEGEYVKVSQFITDLENNSDLYFRIYDFKMTGKERVDEQGNNVVITVASFVVKGININPKTIS